MLKILFYLSITLFLALSFCLHFGQFNAIDHQILLFMISLRQTDFTAIALSLSLLGGTTFVLIISMILATYIYCRYSLLLACWVMGAMLSSMLGVWLLKLYFSRERPEPSMQLVEVFGASFPSAHSAYAASLASLVILIFRKHQYRTAIVILAFVWCGMMGLSRVYLGAHYPSDVLSGWCFGICWISFLWYILTKNTPGHLTD